METDKLFFNLKHISSIIINDKPTLIGIIAKVRKEKEQTFFQALSKTPKEYINELLYFHKPDKIEKILNNTIDIKNDFILSSLPLDIESAYDFDKSTLFQKWISDTENYYLEDTEYTDINNIPYYCLYKKMSIQLFLGVHSINTLYFNNIEDLYEYLKVITEQEPSLKQLVNNHIDEVNVSCKTLSNFIDNYFINS